MANETGKRRVGLAPLTIAIVAVATPATFALSIHTITEDPRWRPLAQTIENTLRYSEQSDVMVITLDWPAAYGDAGARAMAEHVRKAILEKGIYPEMVINSAPGLEAGTITFSVGPSIIGPLPMAQAVDGIKAAVAAFRL